MRPRFPPWLVETVPELADIENNAIYHFLSIRSRRNLILEFTGPLLMLALSAKFLNLLFTHDSLYVLLYFSMLVFLRMIIPRRPYAEFVRFFAERREEIDIIPLEPRELALDLWASIASPAALRPLRRVNSRRFSPSTRIRHLHPASPTSESIKSLLRPSTVSCGLTHLIKYARIPGHNCQPSNYA